MWHPVVRLLHWMLAVLIVIDFVYDDGGPFHRAIGYAAAAVVLARLTWAANMPSRGGLSPSIPRTIAYLRLLLAGKPPRSVGHDPLGLWMVWLLWLLVLLLGVTGWMTRLDAFWGDERVHDLHAVLADLLALSVALHLAGVATMSWLWRDNLPASMVTGTKRPIDEGG